MARTRPPRGPEPEDPGLNPTAASLLGFLHAGPMTGWQLLDAVGSSIGYFWNVTKSHVYRELQSLEARGLVAAGPVGPRQSRPLSITPEGRTAFAGWISQEPAQELIRFPLLVTMFFGEHLDPEELEGFVALHRRRHEQRLAEYEQIASGLAAGLGPSAVPALSDRSRHFALATVRLGLEYERAVLRWIRARPWEEPAVRAARAAGARPRRPRP